MANEYVSTTTLKSTLSLTGESFADDDIAAACTAASRAIDNETGRRFWIDGTANNVRMYTPDDANSGHIEIDDLVQVGSVLIDLAGDGTFTTAWTVGNHYMLEPYNAALDGAPYTRITRRTQVCGPFSTYSRSLRVTGQFGWPAVPASIIEATTLLAHRLLRRAREAPFGMLALGVDTGSIMRLSRTDPDVYMLISPYSRKKLLV